MLHEEEQQERRRSRRIWQQQESYQSVWLADWLDFGREARVVNFAPGDSSPNPDERSMREKSHACFGVLASFDVLAYLFWVS